MLQVQKHYFPVYLLTLSGWGHTGALHNWA
jgi:hypothetical protein